MSKEIDDGIKKRKISVRRKKDGFVVSIDGFPYLIEDGKILPDGRLEFTYGGKTHKIFVAQEGENSFIKFNGKTYRLKEVEEVEGISSQSSESSLEAPLPGKITKILVKPGDVVTAKQQLIILEAMKMEHIISAPYAGTVKKVLFKVNDQVKEGQALVELEPMDKIEHK